MLLRNLSAASQSFCSKPIFAELLFDDLRDLARAIVPRDFSTKLFLVGRAIQGQRR